MDEDSENENELIINQPEQWNNENKRMRKPNSKYKDFYQFLITQQYNKNTSMEINEYDAEEAEIMLMFTQKQLQVQLITQSKEYVIHKHIISERASLNMAIKVKKQ